MDDRNGTCLNADGLRLLRSSNLPHQRTLCQCYGQPHFAKPTFDCTKILSQPKAPDIVYVLNELPKGPSGKIQRLKLAEMVALSDEQ